MPLALTGTQPLTGNPDVATGGNTLDNRYFTGLMDEVALCRRRAGRRPAK